MKFYLKTAAVLLLAAQPAVAENAYRWTDSKGVIFYGSKPPANATHVEKIQPKNYSRYSSSKLLRGYTAPVSGTNSNTDKSSRAAMKQSGVHESDVQLPPTGKGLESQPIEQTVHLDSGKAAVDTGAKGEVKSCRATVTNHSVIDVEGIQVAFEFPDGTLVTADGPSRLNANQAAIYSIPQENLPLILAEGTKPDAKVIVNSDAEVSEPEQR